MFQDRIYYHIKLRLLTTVPLLRCASQACASTIATQMSRVLCPPGKFLVREGEMGDCMFFLVRGMVEVRSDPTIPECPFISVRSPTHYT